MTEAAAHLGNVDELTTCRRVVEDAWVDQAVVEDDVGRFQQLAPAHGQQPRIARSRADEKDGHNRSSSRAARARREGPSPATAGLLPMLSDIMNFTGSGPRRAR